MMRRRVWIGLATLIGIGLLAAPAAAETDLGTENGLTYVTDTTPTAPGNSTAPDAVCPPDKHLVGGGGDAVTGFAASGGLINSLQPRDGDDADSRPDDYVIAYSYNTTATTSTTQVWAVCTTGRVIYRSKAVTMRVNRAKTAKATCPEGSQVVGGGNYITGPNNEAQIQVMRPFDAGDADKKPDDGWRVRAFNLLGADKDVTAYAYCRKNADAGYDGAFGSSSSGPGGASGGECNAKGLSVSGLGAHIRGEPSLVRLSAIYPDDISGGFEAGTVPDDYVLAQGENNTTEDVRFGAFAACLALP